MTDRRYFMIGLGTYAVVMSLAVHAKTSTKPARVGVIAGGSPDGTGYLIDAFTGRMNELRYAEGIDVIYEKRYAFGKMERLADIANELVALKPDVIFATYTGAARAAQQATSVIPIVVGTGDPIAAGLASSLAHPGGNVTGLAGLNVDVSPKLLELLLLTGPSLVRIARLGNPTNPNSIATLRALQTAARSTGVHLFAINARTPTDIEDAFSRIDREKMRAVIVEGDAFFVQQRHQIAELVSKSGVLSIFSYREHVEAGGLMSYGENLAERFRLAADYVDKILKGARPGDLPIEQPTTFEFVINLKTAKALGIAIPQLLFLSADKVIQ